MNNPIMIHVRYFFGLYFVILLFSIFAFTSLHPATLAQKHKKRSEWGKVDRHILRVWNIAKEDALKPYNQVDDHFLFHRRNPGLFKYLAEMSYRLGARSPIPLQVFLILLVNLGIVAQFFWVRKFFGSDLIANASLLFIIGTHFLTHFGYTIHQHPYNYAFFNISLFFATQYGHKRKLFYFVVLWLSYFLLCQNYYMFWVSTFIMAVGIFYYYRIKIVSWQNFILGLAPVLTFVLVILQVLALPENSENGFRALQKWAVWRSVGGGEIAVENPQYKMTYKDILIYPWSISMRVMRYFHIPGLLFLVIAFILYRLKRLNRSELNYGFFYFAVAAAFSWYIFMFQHTRIHLTSGRYSYFLWMLILSFLVYEINSYIKNKQSVNPRLDWLKYTGIFMLIYGVWGFAIVNIGTIVQNIHSISRYYGHKEKAVQGSLKARLELLSNKFVNGYQFYNKTWIKEVEQNAKNSKRINAGVVYLRKLTDKKSQKDYLLFAVDKQQFRYSSIFIKNKRVKPEYPNVRIRNWHYYDYVVLSLPSQISAGPHNIRFN